jgi:protein arginine N-methyltransferase 1
VLVDSPSGSVVDLGPRGYQLLALLSGPVALGTALERIESRLEATDVAPAVGVVNQLLEESALVLATGHPPLSSGWADPVEHGRMLHDERRTLAYIAAIKRVVRPGDVVLDVGTGSGVLAVAAARAGARRVYAVEASDIATAARAVVAANGVAERVTVVPGWSRHIDLPEPADVMLSELIGNEPFEEEILETTQDARRRLLGPGARQVPERLTLFARPLLIPMGEARQRAIGTAAVQRWQRLYGMDFRPLVDACPPGPVLMPTEAEVAATWPPVGPAVPLLEIDLTTRDDVAVWAEAALPVDGRTEVNAVAVTFRATLVDDVVHAMDPWRWPTSSWAVSVWVLPEPVTMPAGSTLTVRYMRRVPESPDGLTVEPRPLGIVPPG